MFSMGGCACRQKRPARPGLNLDRRHYLDGTAQRPIRDQSAPMNRKQRRAAAKLGSPATQLLATAVRFHQAGQLVAAEACYRQVLAAQPNLAEAHSNLGNALTAQGNV